MKVVKFLLRSSKITVALAMLVGLISGAGNAVLLALINSLLTGVASSVTELPAFIGLCLLISISRIASELLLIRLGQGTLLRLRIELSRQVLSVPLRRLEEMGPHRVLVTLIDDISNISNAVAI